MPTQPLVRRRRTPETEPPAAPVVVITDEMRTLAATFFTKNKLKNEADGAAKKARKNLFSAMSAAGVEAFESIIHEGDTPVTLETNIYDKTTLKVDMEVLKKLVTPDQYKKIISATKGDIETYAGEDVATQVCSTVKTGEKEVSVSVKGAAKRGRPAATE